MACYQITAPHFVAGIDIEEGTVTDAAPIVRYMKGWLAGRVRGYCAGKKWKLEVVE